MAKTYDVVVVGARVLLIDAYGPASSRASSGGETRIIRTGYGPDEIYSRWAQESLEAWQQLFRSIGQELFYPTGVLWLGRSDEPRATTTLETLKRLGIRHEWLTQGQIRQRWPQIQLEPLEEAIFEPASGGLAARRAVQAVVAEYERREGEFRRESALPPSETGGWLDEITLGSGAVVSGEQYVFACGPWLGKLFPKAVGARVVSTRQEVFFFGVPAGDRRFSTPLLPIWYRLSDEFYGFPDIDGRGVKIASDRRGPEQDPDTAERLPTAEALGEARAALARVLPDLERAPLVEARVCQYENTANGDFLIDRHPELKNVWLVGGGSGHGFKHGPALGRYVTRLVLENGETDAQFSLASKEPGAARSIR
jgi:sarcosine oxidase